MYNFKDFLPLEEYKAGQIYINNRPSALWVVKPNFLDRPTMTQIQFRNPTKPGVWASDVWDKRSTGPGDIPYWYLNSHSQRQIIDDETRDFEYPIVQQKSILSMTIDSIEYTFDVSEPETSGIPYFRQSFNTDSDGLLYHRVQNWYWIVNHVGATSMHVYHDQIFEYKEFKTFKGVEWLTPSSDNREGIKLSEAYWDKNLKTGEALWKIGYGDVDSLGVPTGINVVMGRSRVHAYKTSKETGIMAWNSDNGKVEAGTAKAWNYK